MQLQKSPGSFFTQQARDAARAVRQANALNRKHNATLEVFVVRRMSLPAPFAWEIRRFGGVILLRSEVVFPSMALARAAGRQALAGMPSS